MKENVRVHVLLFKNYNNDHLEIVLELTRQKEGYYYLIDQWSHAKAIFSKTCRMCLKSGEFIDLPFGDYIDMADEKKIINIEASPEEIIQCWQEKQAKTTKHWFQAVNHNCADAVIWFLNKYAEMPEPSPFQKPVTYNHSLWGCCMPSFFQCVSIPEQVMGHFKEWSQESPLENIVSPKLF
jgi:hypothetical protein